MKQFRKVIYQSNTKHSKQNAQDRLLQDQRPLHPVPDSL